MSTKTVLLADDSESVRGILDFLLTSKGLRVIQAVHGEDALQKIQAQRPDLLVLDAQMPLKSGFEVCMELKSDEKTSAIPILMLTAVMGAASETVRRMRKDLQPDLLVPKPFKVNDLVQKIQELLEKAPSSSVA